MVERTLFSIENGQKSSLGARLEFGRICKDPLQKVVPELAVVHKGEGFESIGTFIWQGGNLGELWNFQLETYQFILDNIGKVDK